MSNLTTLTNATEPGAQEDSTDEHPVTTTLKTIIDEITNLSSSANQLNGNSSVSDNPEAESEFGNQSSVTEVQDHTYRKSTFVQTAAGEGIAGWAYFDTKTIFF